MVAPPPSRTFPAGQVAVAGPTSVFVAGLVTEAVVPVICWEPGRPVGPLAPVVPLAPVGPVAPRAPVGPVGPRVPVAPLAPVVPFAPVGPRTPVGPRRHARSCATGA